MDSSRIEYLNRVYGGCMHVDGIECDNCRNRWFTSYQPQQQPYVPPAQPAPIMIPYNIQTTSTIPFSFTDPAVEARILALEAMVLQLQQQVIQLLAPKPRRSRRSK